MLAMAAPVGDARVEDPRPDDGRIEMAQLTIEQRVIIRVPLIAPPVQRARPAPPVPPLKWKEKDGPKCLQMKQIRSATIPSSDSIDLLLADGQRMRARMEKRCSTFGFYSGFYMKPSEDGRLCAGRDLVLARGGMDCEIRAFKRLVVDH